MRLIFSTAIALLLLSGNAFAQDTTHSTVRERSPEEVSFEVAVQRGKPAALASHRRSDRPRVELVIDVQLRFDAATGGQCVYVFDRPGDPDAPDTAERERVAIRLMARFPSCPGSKPLAARPSPAAVALTVWERDVVLDKPQPYIAPGWALTGKPAYLEIGGPRTLSRTFDAFGYAVAIDATSVYDIDWGDGIVEREVTREPGPWPDGQIAHVYTHARPHTVTVTQRWSADWRIATATGTIPDRLFTTGTFSFTAREIEPVLRR